MSVITVLSDSRIKVQGSVTSVNAAEFEEELLGIVSGQELTIDAEELAYISSAGLRVLLKAKKKIETATAILPHGPICWQSAAWVSLMPFTSLPAGMPPTRMMNAVQEQMMRVSLNTLMA